ncbi:MAG: hypothetical protein JXN64_11835 [Spirochaetes bacterium]|nr:hypothetical protein [Spirochaetota bacterium]
MKKTSIMCFVLTLALMFGLSGTKANSEENKISVPVSMSYSGTYWWRGIELDGPGVGVFWPGAGISYGDLSMTFAAGIAETWITSEDSASEKSAKSLTEIDLGAAYTVNAEMLSVALGLMYIGYPYYNEVDPDAVEASFIEGSIVVTLKTILSPYAAFYYDYFLNERDEETPVKEDYYLKAGISHDLISTEDGFAFSLGGYVGYYNNAYFDMSGWSDAVLTAGLTKSYKDMSFTSSFNYGRTLGRDFRDYNSGIKNHFWAGFGASITL